MQYSDPLELGVVLDIGGVSQPATLTAVHTKSGSGEWIEVSTEELRHLHVRIGLCGALRLAKALLAVSGSSEHSQWDRWLQKRRCDETFARRQAVMREVAP